MHEFPAIDRLQTLFLTVSNFPPIMNSSLDLAGAGSKAGSSPNLTTPQSQKRKANCLLNQDSRVTKTNPGDDVPPPHMNEHTSTSNESDPPEEENANDYTPAASANNAIHNKFPHSDFYGFNYKKRDRSTVHNTNPIMLLSMLDKYGH